MPAFDLITLGRSSIDLYSNDVGKPFPEITSFAAYVGGSPTNIAVGAARLGATAAVITGLGNDPVGDFIHQFLEAEGVSTAYIPRIDGARTSAVVLGIEPPDKFPLVYYRDNCADIQITIDHVLAAPIAEAKILELSGTALSKEPSRSAAFVAAETARAAGVTVVLDIDFRADQWHDVRAFGVVVRSLLPLVDVAIGTEDEINAAMLRDAAMLKITHSQISDPEVGGDVEEAIIALQRLGPEAVVCKRGALGATIHVTGETEVIEAPGFPVEIQNILGAGDAFGAGFIYGRLQGWDWRRSARLGNACGAIVVTAHGCANFMPTLDEAMAFADSKGGL